MWLDENLVDLILQKASIEFDWSQISPTIFGAVFESTLNPEKRRAGGMHYTSIENIHKVIDPLFLDDLHEELEKIEAIQVIRTKKQKLDAFQKKLASLKFLDPACGSGNFLTETYISLRRLENQVIKDRIEIEKGQIAGQMTIGDLGDQSPIKVGIDQFYGIEINDFAVTVGKTALWIAESQMMQETEEIVHFTLDFLPLKTNATIIEGNALRIDWNDVCPASQLNYIMGNPPFVGSKFMSEVQRKEISSLYSESKSAGTIDYVSGWFFKASQYMKNSEVETAFVSTNSITQGEQVAPVWKPLYEKFGVHINFAYRTFKWGNEANNKALVYCVIMGFSVKKYSKPKIIFEKDGLHKKVNNINAYLIDFDDIFIESRTKPICNVPEIGIGNKPIDGGYYLFTEAEMEAFIKTEPLSKPYFHPWYGANELLYNTKRFCLYLDNCPPNELKKMPECLKRIEAVKNYRLNSKSAGTRKIANTPTKFHVTNLPQSTYIVIPEATIATRRYIPMGFLTPDIMCSNLVKLIPNAGLYHFGILMSNVHMAWMRRTCGYYGPSYRYSKNIVYNNFPWVIPLVENKKTIEQTAQGILDARALYPDSSLADLYDPLTMPPELITAHQKNDMAVMRLYGFQKVDEDGKKHWFSEEECVAALMKMYQQLVAEQSK